VALQLVSQVDDSLGRVTKGAEVRISHAAQRMTGLRSPKTAPRLRTMRAAEGRRVPRPNPLSRNASTSSETTTTPPVPLEMGAGALSSDRERPCAHGHKREAEAGSDVRSGFELATTIHGLGCRSAVPRWLLATSSWPPKGIGTSRSTEHQRRVGCRTAI